MGEKPDLEMKLFYREKTLMSGESLGPYTCGATDPDFKHSEVYVDNAVRLDYWESSNSPAFNVYTSGSQTHMQYLIRKAIRAINDSSIHELSHRYSKCGHSNLISAQGLDKNGYIRDYTEKDFEHVIKKILDWCDV